MTNGERRAEDYYHGHHRWNRWVDFRISLGSVIFAVVIVIGYYVDQERERQQVEANTNFIEVHDEEFRALRQRASRHESRMDSLTNTMTDTIARISRNEDRNADQYKEIIRRLEAQQARSDEILQMLSDKRGSQ